MAHTLPADMIDNYGLFEGLARWAYDVTNGAFWTFMLAGFCIVLFIATQKYTTARAFGYAGVTGLLGALMLATLQLMPWWIATIFILGGIVAIVSMVVAEK